MIVPRFPLAVARWGAANGDGGLITENRTRKTENVMWITLNEEDVQGRLAGAELTALKSSALASGKTAAEVLAQAIEDVTKEVRGYVAACTRNQLGDGATIPDELKGAALALVRDYLFTRLPGMKMLNDEIRQKEVDRAMSKLRDAANCKLLIVQPETASAAQAAGPSTELVNSRTRVATREKMKGLL